MPSKDLATNEIHDQLNGGRYLGRAEILNVDFCADSRIDKWRKRRKL